MKYCIIFGNGDSIELEGTEEQYKAFEIAHGIIKKEIYPRVMSRDRVISIALEFGLSVKKKVFEK